MEPNENIAFSIQEFCRWAGIGCSLTYKEIEAGRLRTKKVGRRTIIPIGDATSWIYDLPDGGNANTLKVKRS